MLFVRKKRESEKDNEEKEGGAVKSFYIYLTRQWAFNEILLISKKDRNCSHGHSQLFIEKVLLLMLTTPLQ